MNFFKKYKKKKKGFFVLFKYANFIKNSACILMYMY